MTQWEYVWIHERPRGDETRSEELNKLGVEGWEAVSAVSASPGRIYVLLKRPVG